MVKEEPLLDVKILDRKKGDELEPGSLRKIHSRSGSNKKIL